MPAFQKKGFDGKNAVMLVLFNSDRAKTRKRSQHSHQQGGRGEDVKKRKKEKKAIIKKKYLYPFKCQVQSAGRLHSLKIKEKTLQGRMI